MWISKNMLSGARVVNASAGAVSTGADKRVMAYASGGKGQFATIAPAGIISVPTKNDEAVVVETVSGPMCLGVRTRDHNFEVQPGEIMLASLGGAYLKLANDGKIYINGSELINGSGD